MPKQSLHARFKKFELENSVFEITIDEIPVWERIRHGIFRKIRKANGYGKAHTLSSSDSSKYFLYGKQLLKNIFYKNPYLSSSSDIVVVGHSRRKQMEDGFYWDLYTDPVHPHFNDNYLHLEFPIAHNHRRPVPTERIRYLDMIKYGGALQRKMGFKSWAPSGEMERRLCNIGEAINKEFGCSIDLIKKVKNTIEIRRSRLWMYKSLFERVNPNLVVKLVSYGDHTLIEACKELSIPVVELQHGVIHKNHYGYSFEGSRKKEMFPDYLLTWGEFWSKNTEFPIPDSRVISTGYPYLEQRKDDINNRNDNDQVIFISQGTIGEKLSKFATNLSELPDFEYDIVYKLHPGEYEQWATRYPWLSKSDIEVIDDSGPRLYKLFCESDVQIGVTSTALYEGLSFGLETIIYDINDGESTHPLVEAGAAKRGKNVEDVVSQIIGESPEFDESYFFEKDATVETSNTIERLSQMGTTYVSN